MCQALHLCKGRTSPHLVLAATLGCGAALASILQRLRGGGMQVCVTWDAQAFSTASCVVRPCMGHGEKLQWPLLSSRDLWKATRAPVAPEHRVGLPGPQGTVSTLPV